MPILFNKAFSLTYSKPYYIIIFLPQPTHDPQFNKNTPNCTDGSTRVPLHSRHLAGSSGTNEIETTRRHCRS